MGVTGHGSKGWKWLARRQGLNPIPSIEKAPYLFSLCKDMPSKVLDATLRNQLKAEISSSGTKKYICLIEVYPLFFSEIHIFFLKKEIYRPYCPILKTYQPSFNCALCGFQQMAQWAILTIFLAPG